jgi:hypothetical protein
LSLKPSIADFLAVGGFVFMNNNIPTANKERIWKAEAIDGHSLKVIEQFSREVCCDVMVHSRDKSLSTEITYGFCSFLVAVFCAIKNRNGSSDVRRRT